MTYICAVVPGLAVNPLVVHGPDSRRKVLAPFGLAVNPLVVHSLGSRREPASGSRSHIPKSAFQLKTNRMDIFYGDRRVDTQVLS